MNMMGQQEASDKHNQLKSLLSVTRSLLLEMRDRQGYLALGFSSFEEYGEKEWGYSRTYINRLANAELVQKSLVVPIGTEIPETHLRELAKIPEAERQAIYDQAKAEADAENKAITAKLIREKADAEAQAKHLENLNQHQSKDIARIITVHQSLVDEFNALESSVDEKAAELAAKKVEEKQTELQANLNAIVAKVESENQDAVSNLNLTIMRLTAEKNALLKNVNSDQNDKLNQDLATAQAELDELLAKQIEAKAALNQLAIDGEEAHAEKQANHAYMGLANALSTDVYDHIENIKAVSHLIDESGNPIPLYPLTDYSKDSCKKSQSYLETAQSLSKHWQIATKSFSHRADCVSRTDF